MPRERQFGDLRSSRESRRSNLNESQLSQNVAQTPKRQFDRTSKASSTQSFYVCVNCENINMSAQKEKESRQRRQLERSRYSELEKSRRIFDQHLRQSQQKKQEEEKQKILDENKRMIESHMQAKQKQRKAIEREQELEKQRQRQNEKMFQQDMIEREKRAQDIRNSLEKQIEQKHQKKLKEQMEERYQQPIDNSEEQRYIQLSKQKLDHFKEGLLQQIKDNEEKKRQQKMMEQEHGKTTFALMKLAEQRAKEMLAEENRRKAMYQDQIRDLARSTEKKKKQEYQQRQQQKMQAALDRQFDQKQFIQNEKMKASRLNKYRDEIKQQIAEKQKEKERQKYDRKYATGYMNTTIQEIQRKMCDSCQKPYPKNYMTRYRRKKK